MPHHDDPVAAVRTAGEELATSDPRPPAPPRSPVEAAAPAVLGAIVAGTILFALAAVAGSATVTVATAGLGLVAGGGAAGGLVLLARRATADDRRREALAARHHRDEADRRAALLAALEGAVDHLRRLDAERTRLHRKVERLERSVAAKERKIARLQAFDAQRRTLEPAPDPLEGQLTFDTVADG